MDRAGHAATIGNRCRTSDRTLLSAPRIRCRESQQPTTRPADPRAERSNDDRRSSTRRQRHPPPPLRGPRRYPRVWQITPAQHPPAADDGRPAFRRARGPDSHRSQPARSGPLPPPRGTPTSAHSSQTPRSSLPTSSWCARRSTPTPLWRRKHSEPDATCFSRSPRPPRWLSSSGFWVWWLKPAVRWRWGSRPSAPPCFPRCTGLSQAARSAM
jgi:hypothetical protein